MAESKVSSVVSLNEVTNLLSALRSDELRQILGRGGLAADCDIRCGCNTRDCGCHGSVSSSIIDEVSFPEFQRMREERVAELKAQLSRLEATD